MKKPFHKWDGRTRSTSPNRPVNSIEPFGQFGAVISESGLENLNLINARRVIGQNETRPELARMPLSQALKNQFYVNPEHQFSYFG